MSRTRKSKYLKLASLRFSITDREEWLIEIMADYGFSYKYIAQRVFRPRGGVDDSHIRAVGSALRRAGMKVRDYRNGKNKIGRKTSGQLLKQKETKKKSTKLIRAAS